MPGTSRAIAAASLPKVSFLFEFCSARLTRLARRSESYATDAGTCSSTDVQYQGIADTKM